MLQLNLKRHPPKRLDSGCKRYTTYVWLSERLFSGPPHIIDQSTDININDGRILATLRK